jgi:hypothetical protein
MCGNESHCRFLALFGSRQESARHQNRIPQYARNRGVAAWYAFPVSGLFPTVTWRAAVVLAVAQSVLFSGCNRADSDRLVGEPASRIAPVATTSTNGAAVEPVLLKHDFGIVRPNEVLEHEFTIPNGSSVAWSVDRFQSSCGCTVPMSNSDLVPPRGLLRVRVRYRAKSECTDDFQRVVLTFHEREAPSVRFEIRASIRDEMTILPDHVEWAVVQGGAGRTIGELELRIENYGAVRWQRVRAASSAPWLNVRTVERPDNASESRVGRASQVWTGRIVIRPQNLRLGYHDGVLKLTAHDESGKSIERHVPVRGAVQPAYTVVPSQLFLGKVRRGQSARGSVRVLFHKGVNVASMNVRPEMQTLPVACELHPMGATCWMVTAELRASRLTGTVDANVRLTTDQPGVPLVEVPLRALITE